jgi:hypothetical protein
VKTALAEIDAAYPTPTATPEIARGQLRDGAGVRVAAGAGDCLNARSQPSLDDSFTIINFCLPDGFEGYISGNPQEADGRWWWYIAGAGWVAEEWLEFQRYADLRAPQQPQLSSAGRIAFVRDA